jgi:hypothetical protein
LQSAPSWGWRFGPYSNHCGPQRPRIFEACRCRFSACTGFFTSKKAIFVLRRFGRFVAFSGGEGLDWSGESQSFTTENVLGRAGSTGQALKRSLFVKQSRMKKLMLAVSGFVAFQAAGCGFLEQLQEQIVGLIPNIPGITG